MIKPLILVTGGTGFVGRSIVKELLQSGFSVRVLTRAGDSGDKLANLPDVQVQQADIYSPSEVSQSCEGVQAVIHLVGIINQSFADPFEKVHVEAVRSVIAGVKAAGVKRYLQMSALGTRKGAPSQYHRTKWEGEEIVRQSGLNWTILRPSLIFGRGDGFVMLFAKLLTFPLNLLNLYTFPRLGGGKTLFQPISVKNVAEAFVRALSREATIQKDYELCGTDRLTLTQILHEIVSATGQKCQVEHFPILTALRTFTWLLALAIPLLVIPGIIVFHLGFIPGILSVMVWLLVVAVVIRWKSIILFTLPWPIAFSMALLTQNIWIFGKPLLTVDQLIMLQENNVGDYTVAQKVFDLKLQSFAEGIRTYLPASKTSPE